MRPSVHEWAMNLVDVVSTRGTCHRRQVGCVLMNNRNHIIAAGYNGVASGLPHCRGLDGIKCQGAKSLSGENLDQCGGIHAEQNALIQCKNVWDIKTAYISCSPCVSCCKLLLGTTCETIVYWEGNLYSKKAEELWLQSGRTFLEVSKRS